jgi:hypothetical protein
VTRREQQGALIQVKVEVESGLGIGGKRGTDCMHGMGLSRIVGQLQGHVPYFTSSNCGQPRKTPDPSQLTPFQSPPTQSHAAERKETLAIPLERGPSPSSP